MKTSCLSGCSGAKTAAQVCVSKLAMSASQYFYNPRAGRAEDDQLLKICVHTPLLYNVTHCTMPPSVVRV